MGLALIRNRIDDLDGYFARCHELHDSKSGLQRLLNEVTAYLYKHEEDIDIEAIKKEHPLSNKWSRLLLHTIFIHGTVSGLLTATLPELVRVGVITMSAASCAVLAYFIPLLVALPYFIYKIKNGMSKHEQTLRIQEILLKAQFSILNREIVNRGIQVNRMPVSLSSQAPLLNTNLKRGVFNSTLLETFYLTGSLLPLGVSILATLSVTAFMPWLVIVTLSLLAGVAYAGYHHKVITSLNKKKHEINALSARVYELKFTLFNSSTKYEKHPAELKRVSSCPSF